jgi:hypothetical protein
LRQVGGFLQVSSTNETYINVHSHACFASKILLESTSLFGTMQFPNHIILLNHVPIA